MPDRPTDPAPAAPVPDSVALRPERLVAGGDALARDPEGRVVLVEGALPGELVLAEAPTRRKGVLRSRALEVLEPSGLRGPVHCPHVAAGCGGCDLPGVDLAGQRALKVEVVADALRRLGRVVHPAVEEGPSLPGTGFRTTLRAAVHDGRAGLRAARSHDVVDVPGCAVAHPALRELLDVGRFGAAHEVTLRVGEATGERLALAAPTAADVHLPPDVVLVGADELGAGRRAWIHDVAAGRRWRISAGSFFQTRTDGATALVDVVRATAADVLVPSGGGRPATLVDAYCGVGLFAGGLLDGLEGWRGVAVERSGSSVADARHNLADLPVRVVGAPVERFRPPRADLVVADPARAGLGRGGVAAVAASRAPVVVLVSCDPASAGRDVALLGEAGYRHTRSTVVDLFPHTHHVEVVTRLDRDVRS